MWNSSPFQPGLGVHLAADRQGADPQEPGGRHLRAAAQTCHLDAIPSRSITDGEQQLSSVLDRAPAVRRRRRAHLQRERSRLRRLCHGQLATRTARAPLAREPTDAGCWSFGNGHRHEALLLADVPCADVPW